jgi:hypothetical protein
MANITPNVWFIDHLVGFMTKSFDMHAAFLEKKAGGYSTG